MIHGPVSKNGAPIDIAAGYRAKYTRIVGTDAMVTHHEIAVARHADGSEIADVFVLRRNIGFRHHLFVDVDGAAPNFHNFARQSNHALDERFRAIQRIPEDHDIAALNRLETVDKFVDEDAFLVGEQRGHAGAFDLYRLV